MTTTDPTTSWDTLRSRRSLAGGGDAIAGIMAQTELDDLITFSGGFPDPATFPADVVAELAAGLPADQAVAMQYTPTSGLAGTRDAVATWLAGRGDPRPGEAELMITSGGIDALGLLARSYLDPGDVVLVEAPTYLGAIMAFSGYEAEVVGVPVDGGGIDVAALEGLLAGGLRPKFLYTIPDFANPTGLSMDVERRPAVVEACRRHGVLVIEDVAYRELGFGQERRSSLWSLGPDVVVQLGTFSKTFFPGVRLGWASGPPSVIAAMVTAKQNSDQCAGALGQWLVERYLRSGGMDAQLPRSSALYRTRAAAMADALAEAMPAGAEWTSPGGGFFTWLRLPDGADATAAAGRAMAAGVSYVPGSLFFPDGSGVETLRLSFSCVDEPTIRRGVDRLASVLVGSGFGERGHR